MGVMDVECMRCDVKSIAFLWTSTAEETAPRLR